MTTITIRHVPEATRDELAARAASTGRSLQEFLHAELESLASRPDPDVWLARVRARVAAAGTDISTETILAERDADRR